jgi:hypothetical protein
LARPYFYSYPNAILISSQPSSVGIPKRAENKGKQVYKPAYAKETARQEPNNPGADFADIEAVKTGETKEYAEQKRNKPAALAVAVDIVNLVVDINRGDRRNAVTVVVVALLIRVIVMASFRGVVQEQELYMLLAIVLAVHLYKAVRAE